MGQTHQINAGVQEIDKNRSPGAHDITNNPNFFPQQKFKRGVGEGQSNLSRRNHLDFIGYLAAASDQVKFYPRGERGVIPTMTYKGKPRPKKGTFLRL